MTDDQHALEDPVLAITGIRIGDGELLNLSGHGSVLVVVGANNVGKSTLIQQFATGLMDRHQLLLSTPRILTELATAWSLDAQGIKEWVLRHSLVTDPGDHDRPPSVSRGGVAERVDVMTSPLSNSGGLQHLAQWFVARIEMSDRFSFVAPASAPGPHEPLFHPYQVLYFDHALRDQVIALARKLFGIDLYFAIVGATLSMRIGAPDVAEPLHNEMTRDYIRSVDALTKLEAQGGGVVSALGLLMPMLTSPMPITIIDEPEVYLHPPQARLLGKEIGRVAARNASQVIVATHDKDVLRGLVDSTTPIDILHLTRVNDETRGLLLGAVDVAELWRDPSLRYGNALDGLFHSAVIVTEADRDSRFYEAAIDAYFDARSDDSPAHNLMFLSANGKQNLAKIVTKLRGFGMRVVSCPDLDILNNGAVLKPLVEAHDGRWAAVSTAYAKATNQFTNAPAPPTSAAVKEKLATVLADVDGPLTKELVDRVKAEVALPSSTWHELKRFGMNAFRDDLASANKVITYLDSLGIVIVKVGELERFLTTVTVGKADPTWLTIAFAEGAHTSNDAVDHTERLLTAAGVGLQ